MSSWLVSLPEVSSGFKLRGMVSNQARAGFSPWACTSQRVPFCHLLVFAGPNFRWDPSRRTSPFERLVPGCKREGCLAPPQSCTPDPPVCARSEHVHIQHCVSVVSPRLCEAGARFPTNALNRTSSPVKNYIRQGKHSFKPQFQLP